MNSIDKLPYNDAIAIINDHSINAPDFVTHFGVAGTGMMIVLIRDNYAVIHCPNLMIKDNLREWMTKYKGLSQTADSEIVVVHLSRVIIACTLESLPSLT